MIWKTFKLVLGIISPLTRQLFTRQTRAFIILRVQRGGPAAFNNKSLLLSLLRNVSIKWVNISKVNVSYRARTKAEITHERTPYSFVEDWKNNAVSGFVSYVKELISQPLFSPGVWCFQWWEFKGEMWRPLCPVFRRLPVSSGALQRNDCLILLHFHYSCS